ncbi:ABC transporter substrate binding protein [Neptunomonas antarctica]|uniref:cyclic-guanylate-specific phosphodiesterase n=1 Tax=Neptunomonas antarctica TaxID=619304 RepID=A0A1N7J799_9GAMM|nr:ABC transporter substrate binding protein [Neptunomonas antarctica]SIS45121.1 PAS domain S-box-containing protein/diguanylate cyclase (GGDEF) domain-containing protein [Neptunomonas antarctica]
MTLVTANTDASPRSKVLVINSYHHGFPWSDGIYQGLSKVLEESGLAVDLQVEYLDTKRYSVDSMFPLMASVLAVKNKGHIDAILVTDNNALNFLLRYRSSHFAGIPVVFVGINFYSDTIIENDTLITGIAETTAPDANFQLILTLHPDVKEIVLLSDSTTSGLAEQAIFSQAAEKYASRFSIKSISDWTWSELKQLLTELEPGSVVFRLPLHSDNTGLSISLKESVGILLERTAVPIYSAWDTAIAEGLLGGYVATSTLQGQVAAEYLLDILKGRPVSELPIIIDSPTEPVFNGRAMQHFEIDQALVPENSVILDPEPVGERLVYLIISLIILLTGLGFFVYQWLTKKQELVSLNDELDHVIDKSLLLRALMDSNPDHIYAKGLDGSYIDFNQSFTEFVGRPREEILGRRVEDFFADININLTNEQDAQVFLKGQVNTKEIWVPRREGVDQLIECIKTPLKNPDGKVIGLLAVNRNITRRYFENALLKQNTRVLDMLIRGVPLNNILNEIVKGIEGVYANSLCSILLMAKDKKHLVHGAAPSLPEFYIEAINGIAIGKGVGSCGTAAAIGKLVVVGDIQNHPYWVDFKELALKAGLASCWSQPIIGSGDEVLGTFAIYYRHLHEPSVDHIAMMEQASQLVSLVLERKHVEGDLQKISRALEQSPTMVLITDETGKIEYVNEEFTEVSGYFLNEIRGLTPAILNAGETDPEFYKEMWAVIQAGNDWHGEVLNRTKAGQSYWSMLSISPILDESKKITHYIGVSEDISAKKQTQKQIEQLAFYDPLTRLGNRRLFKEQLEVELKKAKRNSTIFALFYLDLDNFKQINDTLGHDAGDGLLMAIADRLRSTLRNSDLIARLGGDEFIVLLPNVSGPAEVGTVAQKLLKSINMPISLGGSDIKATVSMGITMAPSDGDDWAVLMKNADLAMYRAKSKGRNNFQLFTQEMNIEVINRANMEQQLRSALKNKEFCVHYQPQWTIMSELLPVCLEALVRWDHPQRGRVSPAEFIPIAEELGLIVELGEWVLNESCRQGRQLIDAGHAIRIAVNLSMRQFFDPELLNKITAALTLHNFPASMLELEITESMIIEDVDVVVDTLHQLKHLGVSLAIDDFGTGYSSLSYLKRLPFDHLKVDASFVRDIPHDKNDMEITSAVIAMAHKLGLKVIAEGIETHEQMAFLRENNCEMGQGYLLARPASLEEIMKYIDVEMDSSSD